MTRKTAIELLCVPWFVTFALAAILISIQSLADRYGEQADRVWSWLLNGTAAPMALLTAAVFVDAKKTWARAPADKFRFRMAMAGSLVFCVTLLGSLLIEPQFEAVGRFALLQMTAIPLALFQGIMVAAIASVIFENR